MNSLSIDLVEILEKYDPPMQKILTSLREYIIEFSKENYSNSNITEVIRWNQISFTPKSKTGSMVRIDQYKKDSESYALFFLCNTQVVSKIKEVLGDKFNYDGNRAIIFSIYKKIPYSTIDKCLHIAFTY